jgi:carboxymethylenebutenolidase
LGGPITSFAQSCCSASTAKATNEFAQLATQTDFKAKHTLKDAPNNADLKGEHHTIKINGCEPIHIFWVENENPCNKYVLVFHEWWGLNDHILAETNKLKEALGDVHVIAVDLYDNQIATTPEKAGEIMQSIKDKRAREIINGLKKHLPSDAEFATIGWCFGGGWSLQAALELNKQVKACVLYYGMPETNVEKLSTALFAPVLGVFAAQDKWINKEVVIAFQDNMKKADKPLVVKTFDADHAFANPSNKHYNEKFASEAMATTIEFLKENLHID